MVDLGCPGYCSAGAGILGDVLSPVTWEVKESAAGSSTSSPESA